MQEPDALAGLPEPGLVLDSEASFEAFFESESRPLYRRLCLVTGNRMEAEELMQDAFLKLWERWDRVQGMDEPTGYLYRAAMNLFRKRRRRAALALRKTIHPTLVEDEFAAADTRTQVSAALATLSVRQRAALVLTEMLGFSSEDAGRMLGIKAGTVRSLASQGRAAMKRTLEERP